jgi:hypothetical protein
MLDADDEPRQEQESVGVGGKPEEGEEKRETKRRKQNKDQDAYSIKEINTNHKQKDEDRRKESGLTALKESGGKGWTVDMAPVIIKSVLVFSGSLFFFFCFFRFIILVSYSFSTFHYRAALFYMYDNMMLIISALVLDLDSLAGASRCLEKSR